MSLESKGAAAEEKKTPARGRGRKRKLSTAKTKQADAAKEEVKGPLVVFDVFFVCDWNGCCFLLSLLLSDCFVIILPFFPFN